MFGWRRAVHSQQSVSLCHAGIRQSLREETLETLFMELFLEGNHLCNNLVFSKSGVEYVLA